VKINLKIAGLLFLLSLSVFILYLSINVEDKQVTKIEVIEINDGKYCTGGNYAVFARLDDKNNYSYLDPGIIKDRIERHPYVDKADVKYEGTNKVVVQIKEKTFSAVLIDSLKQILLTEKMQLIPVMPSTTGLDLPVISNIELPEGLKLFSTAKNNLDVVTAFKILDTFKLINDELSAKLSQIDLRNGKDILVYFSDLNFPVVFGRKDEIKKVVYFNNLWKFMKGNEVNNYLDYVDLRFDKHVFLGITEEYSGNEEKRI
jgi:cell division septal protein FtsQ